MVIFVIIVRLGFIDVFGFFLKNFWIIWRIRGIRVEFLIRIILLIFVLFKRFFFNICWMGTSIFWKRFLLRVLKSLRDIFVLNKIWFFLFLFLERLGLNILFIWWLFFGVSWFFGSLELLFWGFLLFFFFIVSKIDIWVDWWIVKFSLIIFIVCFNLWIFFFLEGRKSYVW